MVLTNLESRFLSGTLPQDWPRVTYLLIYADHGLVVFFIAVDAYYQSLAPGFQIAPETTTESLWGLSIANHSRYNLGFSPNLAVSVE